MSVGALGGYDDEGLLHALDEGATTESRALLDALRRRRLFKRAFEEPAATLPMEKLEWIADDRDRTRAAELEMGARLGLAPGELLLDFPAKTQMLGLDIPVLGGDGTVSRLTQDGMDGAMNLSRMAESFYRSARYLRVFTARRVSCGVGVVETLLTV